jgi:hypothetical protein
VEALYTQQTGFYLHKRSNRLSKWEIQNHDLKVNPGWPGPIVNPDIKPGNVVFGKAPDDYYPAYSKCMFTKRM